MNDNQLYNNAVHIVQIAKNNPDPLAARMFLKSLTTENEWIETIAKKEFDTPLNVLALLLPPEIKYILRRLSHECLSWIEKEASSDPVSFEKWNAWKGTNSLTFKKQNFEEDTVRDQFFLLIEELLKNGKIKLDTGLLFHPFPENEFFEETTQHHLVIENPILKVKSILIAKGLGVRSKNARIKIFHGKICLHEEAVGSSYFFDLEIPMEGISEKIAHSQKNQSLVLQIVLQDQGKILVASSFVLLSGSYDSIITNPIIFDVKRITIDSENVMEFYFELKEKTKAFLGEISLSLVRFKNFATVWNQTLMYEGKKLQIRVPIKQAFVSESFILQVEATGSDRRVSLYLPGKKIKNALDFLPSFTIEIPVKVALGEPISIHVPKCKDCLLQFFITKNEKEAHSSLENLLFSKKPLDQDTFLKAAGGWKSETRLGSLTQSPVYLYLGSENFQETVFEKWNEGVHYVHVFLTDKEGRISYTSHRFEVTTHRGGEPKKDLNSDWQNRSFGKEVWCPSPVPSDGNIPSLSSSKSLEIFEPYLTKPILPLDDMIVRIAWNLWNYKMFCAEQISARLFAWWVLSKYGYRAQLDESRYQFLFETLRSYYDEKEALFTIWPGVKHAVVYNEKVLPTLSVFLGGEEPISLFLNEVIFALKNKGISSPAYTGIDPAIGSVSKEPSIVHLWNQNWKNPKSFLPDLERHVREDFPNTSGVWDRNELNAYRLLLFGVNSSLEIKSTKTKFIKNQLTIWDHFTNSIGITEHPETIQVMTQKESQNLVSLSKSIPFLFRMQGGTSLFSSTSSTVAFLQSMIALRRIGSKLNFSLGENEANAKGKKGFIIKTHWQLENSWAVGKTSFLNLEIPKSNYPNLIVSVKAPSHCYLLSGENRFISQGDHFLEFPLMGKRIAQIKIMPFKEGEGILQASVSDMYSSMSSDHFVTQLNI